MKVLMDECLPGPLAARFTGHEVVSVQEHGWGGVKNGALLQLAEGEFDLFLTADKNLRYQQNLRGRKLAIVLLPTNHWPTLRDHIAEIQAALDAARPADFVLVAWS
jgi:predicted nuclease of predicted toxin-antitoxin system